MSEVLESGAALRSLKPVAAVAAGNALALYDFQTFAFFAVQIGHAFFPGSPSSHALLLSLATFGAGFAARPLGAIVIGTYADRVGRKPAMVLSFGLMGFSVVALALTPSAEQIGIAAPILLLIFRLLQGFAVGGELGPAVAFLIEAAPAHRRGLYTSVQSATQGISVLAAGVVGFGLASALSPATFEAWGWRIALLIGGLIVPVGLYIRRNVPEKTREVDQSGAEFEQLQLPWRVIAAGILLVAALTIANYVRTYITTYAQDSLGLATNLAFGATIAQGLGALCAAPLAGLLSDKLGRKPVALGALPLSVVLGVPAFIVMGHTHLGLVVYAVTFALSAIGTLISVPAITLIAESLPRAARARSLAILYAATIAVFGGSTQFVIQWLIGLTGSPLAPAWYQTIALVIGGVALAAVHEPQEIPHTGDGAVGLKRRRAGRNARLPVGWLCWIALALAATLPRNSGAQHASDNPVASAEDAYGSTLGLESTGLYLPFNVRGFNPQAAGNVRIDGLYFDQQGALSNRVVEGSAIHVGVSEIGYVFPAPTGIVDYDLRHPGNGSPSATVVASAGPFQARGLSIDGNLPLISSELQLPLGASYQVTAQTPFGPNSGYTSRVTNFGSTPQWSPNDKLTVRAIIDWQQIAQAKTFPLIFTAGDFLPPAISRGYVGQNWAEGKSLSENFGGIVTAQLNDHWSFTAGVFRSVADSPVSFSDFYVNTHTNGVADHLVVGYPDQSVFSTSGETRLTGHFSSGLWGHEIVFLARGRNTFARYDGSDAVDLGPALITQITQMSEPIFSYSARTADRSELRSVGLAYRAHWQEHADFALGLQQENYDKAVTLPSVKEATLTDRPLRAYGNTALTLTKGLTAYAGFTQGLEDSGVAPSIATNRGAILPAARTWQVDSGIRYMLTPELKLIGGVFEIQKPYFNLDANAIDRDLGVQRAKGFELSLSGQPIEHLDITAGMLAGTVRVIGPDLATEGVGPIAFGQPRLTYVLNATYGIRKWPAISVDLNLTRLGAAPASLDNVLYAHALNDLDLGGRYRFTVLGKPATLRAQIINVTNAKVWSAAYTPGFFQQAPRALFAYLTADF